MLKWIAPKLTSNSSFVIAGTKDPCTECEPRLRDYRDRLVLAGYRRMFTYHDGGNNQDVLPENIRDQVDPAQLAIP